MRLTPWEEDRLLIFSAAELARRHRDAGLSLNAPEAIALICDAMLESAHSGAGYAEVVASGMSAVSDADVMPGVRDLVDEVRLEVLMGDGARLVVLLDPLGPGDGSDVPGSDAIGTIRTSDRAADTPVRPGRGTIELTVASESTRVIRVSSHYPFHRVNRRLLFDRAAAEGYRLDLPAGGTERWMPGETRTVRLVRFAGDTGERSSGEAGGA